MSTAIRRLQKEYDDITKSIHKEIPENISTGPTANMLNWDATIIGAVGTPYEGGMFKLGITFPNNYPFMPPVVKFKTRVFHPNIHENGEICLDILKYHWSPAYTISKVLLSILSLMSDPNPDDPLNPDAANVFKNSKGKYDEMVKAYVQNYAR